LNKPDWQDFGLRQTLKVESNCKVCRVNAVVMKLKKPNTYPDTILYLQFLPVTVVSKVSCNLLFLVLIYFCCSFQYFAERSSTFVFPIIFFWVVRKYKMKRRISMIFVTLYFFWEIIFCISIKFIFEFFGYFCKSNRCSCKTTSRWFTDIVVHSCFHASFVLYANFLLHYSLEHNY
jgi:hypothetical protein